MNNILAKTQTNLYKSRSLKNKPIIGWKEYIDLPELGIFALNAKIDTGARTSALHVTKIRPFQRPDGSDWLELHIPSVKSDGSQQGVVCEAPSCGMRHIKSSSGHIENRYVLTSTMVLGTFKGIIEITLTNRMSMRYAMLLGRTALRSRFLILPSRSYLQSSPGHKVKT